MQATLHEKTSAPVPLASAHGRASVSRAPPDDRRRWGAAVIGTSGMLLLPALAWLLLSAGSLPVLPARPSASVVVTSLPTAALPAAQSVLPLEPPHADLSTPAPNPRDDGLGILGLVLGPKDVPVANATVSCDDRRDVARVDSDAEGRFRLSPDAAGCKAVARQGRFARSLAVVLAAGGENVLRLTGGGGIEGVVVDGQGKPLTTYAIFVETFTPSSDRKELDYQKYVDDPNGVFQWLGLPPGRYVLMASAEGRPVTRSLPIDLADDQTVAGIRIVVGAGAKLEGVVVDGQTKAPIAGANVGLFLMGPYGLVVRAPAFAGVDGVFTMTDLPSRPVPLRVSGKGYEAKTFPDVIAGEERQVFALSREVPK